MKKILYKIVGTVVTIMMIVQIVQAGEISAFAADNPAKSAKKSVVRILAIFYYDGSYVSDSSGTGVCVGQDPFEYVITNRHVVEADMATIAKNKYDELSQQEQMEISELEYYLLFDYEKVDTEVYVAADGFLYELSPIRGLVLSNVDLALLHLNTTIPGRQAIRFGDSNKIESMDKIYALGYPGIAEEYDDKKNTDGFLSDIDDITVTDGIVSRKNVIMGGVTFIQHTADINHGNSGGPLIDENGCLIGINTLGLSDKKNDVNSPVFFSIDVEEVTRFLKQNKVEWIDAASSNSGNPSPTPTPTPIPTFTPAPTPDLSKPGAHDLIGCNESVLYPKDENWLRNYETKYVKTKNGVRAYLRYQPTEDSGYYDYVYEQALVTILARQNGYSLVKTTDGMAGWVTSSVLADYY